MTAASKNIEAAFNKAGATTTHTPGYASERHKETEATASATTEGKDSQGVGTVEHEARIADQWPEHGPLAKIWYKTMTGSKKGPQGQSSWQA